VTDAWWRWVGPRGRVVGIDRFGASAPAKVLFPHYGITVEAVAQAARDSLAG
jgi:transketolase